MSFRDEYSMTFPLKSPTPSFPYRIEGQVGVGSMGTVYRAVEVDLDRTVAIKTLRRSLLEEESPDGREDILRRFRQEAQAAGRISHPGVTTVYRVGEEAGVPYLVMEWLDGQSLDEIMKVRRRLPVQEAARLMVDLLSALDAAHRVGVIHRDVKPSNLVLLKDGRLKVTDFGIARIQGRELVKTQAGVVLATPKFASPEQLQGIEVDGRADVFAAGVLFYHLLTGTFPFLGQSFLELAGAILQHTPTPVTELLPDLPAEPAAIIDKALRKDRQDRYSGAAQMAEDLRSWLQLATAPSAAGTASAPLPDVDIESSVRGLPHDPVTALVELAASWPGKILDEQECTPLVERLLDRPLHAAPFSGAVFLGATCLFLSDGVLLTAADRRGRVGDAAMTHLPQRAVPGLHPVPAEFGSALLPVLVSALLPPHILHADLDSSFINLPALAAKLQNDKFDGLVRLRHGRDWGLVCFVAGSAKLSLYSEGWSRIPVEKSWRHWISDYPIHAQVEHRVFAPPAWWFRRQFADLTFDIQPVQGGADGDASGDGTTGTHLRRLFSSTRTGVTASGRLALRLAAGQDGRPSCGHGLEYEKAPAARFLSWMVEELPRYLAERDLFARFKYLAEWIFLVRQGRLYHRLPRPGRTAEDFFDVVTFGDGDKVLHLAHRVAELDGPTFAAQLERIVEAKTARKKTGDVGGVFLIARHVHDDALAAYREAIGRAAAPRWLGMEESLTGYEGFVRIGPRRGFHLLLVEESDDGTFEPILPSTLS